MARLVLATLLLFACARRVPEADPHEIQRIAAARDTLRTQIDSLQRVPAQPQQSLFDTMRQMRLHVLLATDDLLRHKSEALTAGVEFRYEQPAFRAQPERADSLSREIGWLQDSLRASQARAASAPPGSLMGLVASLEVESRALTIATLEMARLSALYGIGLPALRVDSVRARR